MTMSLFGILFALIAVIVFAHMVGTLFLGGGLLGSALRQMRRARQEGLVEQVLTMRDAMEKQLTTDCSYCGGKRARDKTPCANCGATPD